MTSAISEKTYRILAIDDLPDNLELIEAMLDGQGYAIQCLQDGLSAVDDVRKTYPDLILLDVMMPDIDGYEITRQIRQDPTIPYIPILLITADDRSNVVQGLDAGADDFIRKPVDIDELLARVRSLLRLKQSIDEQRAILQQRDDFVARLTHDLRTPLVAGNRMLQFCLQGAFGELSEEMNEVLTNLLHNHESLLQMANTLLEVYRHEAGRKSLTLTTLDLRPLIQEVVDQLQPLVEEKSLPLHLHLPPDQTPEAQRCQVVGDRLELRRVLTNLMDNAIKFTDQGWIAVAARPAPAAPGKEADGHLQDRWLPADAINGASPATGWVEVAVTDTGPGLSAEERQTVFEWFRPGKHLNSSSGLGLHLSRRIAEMHGGSLTVTSQPGQGSTFHLRLPIADQRLSLPTSGPPPQPQMR